MLVQRRRLLVVPEPPLRPPQLLGQQYAGQVDGQDGPRLEAPAANGDAAAGRHALQADSGGRTNAHALLDAGLQVWELLGFRKGKDRVILRCRLFSLWPFLCCRSLVNLVSKPHPNCRVTDGVIDKGLQGTCLGIRSGAANMISFHGCWLDYEKTSLYAPDIGRDGRLHVLGRQPIRVALVGPEPVGNVVEAGIWVPLPLLQRPDAAVYNVVGRHHQLEERGKEGAHEQPLQPGEVGQHRHVGTELKPLLERVLDVAAFLQKTKTIGEDDLAYSKLNMLSGLVSGFAIPIKRLGSGGSLVGSERRVKGAATNTNSGGFR